MADPIKTAAGANMKVNDIPPVRATEALMQEMENIIPLVASKEDVEAYQLAKAMCSPEIIQSEADPIRFLEFCKLNPWAASKRMIEYWKLRLETFGPERFWKRVLDTSGTQALSPAAARIAVEEEAFYLLPPDKDGRTVLFQSMEKAKIKKISKLTSEDRKAVTFYGLQLAASHPASVKKGFIFIQVRLESGYKFFPEGQQLFADATKSCLPMSLKGVHLICAPKQKETIHRRFANHLLPFIWKLMERLVSHSERRTLDFVAWSNGSGRREKLQDLLINKIGLTREGLPVVAGGSWNLKRFRESNLSPPATLPGVEAILAFDLLDFDDQDLEILMNNSCREGPESSRTSPTFFEHNATLSRKDISHIDTSVGFNTCEGQDEPRSKKVRY